MKTLRFLSLIDAIYYLCTSCIFDQKSRYYKNKFDKLSAEKAGELILCRYSMTTIWTSNGIENKQDVYRGEGCMKTFCEPLLEDKIKIINSEKNKTMQSTNEQQESHEKKNVCHICNEKIEHK